MFSILILGLAAAASSEPMIVVDDQPTISIDLTRFDLRKAEGVRRLEASIHGAANRVCGRGYGAALYLERVACVKSTIADADRQRDEIMARQGFAPPLAASIAVEIPSE